MNKRFKFGLLGGNISYSKSPAIFQTIFQLDGVEGEFDLIDMKEDKTESSLKYMMASDYDAFSVTVPYKQIIINFLSKIDATAQKIGAVNSVIIENRKLIGYNTDFIGFAKPLSGKADLICKGQALIFGNGGSAKTVIFSLVNLFQIKEITVVGRQLDKLLIFKNDIENINPEVDITLSSYENYTNLTQKYSLIVNTTPIGGPNFKNKSLLKGDINILPECIYYDLNYNNDNCTLAQAEKAGFEVINGVPMLISQAIESYKIWTGRKISFEEVFDKLEDSF